MWLVDGCDDHSGAAGGHHEHSIGLPKDFIVKVHTDDSIRAEGQSALLKFLKCQFPGILKLALVGGGTATHEVPDASKQILEEVCSEDGFAGYYTAVALN